jgi:hypothetical protein
MGSGQSSQLDADIEAIATKPYKIGRIYCEGSDTANYFPLTFTNLDCPAWLLCLSSGMLSM